MRIEAFSEGKVFARPRDNEDAFLVLPGMGYAVVDGVTDRSGRLFGAQRGGRFAAQTVIRAVAETLAAEDLSVAGGEARVARLLAHVDARLVQGYAAHGRLDEARASADARAGATLALVFHDGDDVRMVAIGDSGVRVAGATGAFLHLDSKPLDRITALIRRETWRHLEGEGAPQDRRETIAMAAVARGLGAAPEGLAAHDAQAIAARVAAICAQEMPQIASGEIAQMIAGGVSAQRRFANREQGDLAYGVIDGFGVPARHIVTRAWPRAEVTRIELFSDGYFDAAPGFGVAAWEARFREVEAQDPHKIGEFASMKGTTAQSWTDDRTYLGVELAPRA